MVLGMLVVVSTLLNGCASLGTYNPATNQNEFIVIPTFQEINMGLQMHAQLQKEYTFSNDPVKLQRMKSVALKIAQVSDRQDYKYQFFLIDQDEMNAFTTPGGNIYFFTGLLDSLTSDDQIAFVLAHEVGHCAAKHTIKKYQASMGANIIGSLVIGQLAPEAQNIAKLSTGAALSLAFSAYSRQDEFQADQLGVKYMTLAGYNKKGAVEALQVLEKASKGDMTPLMLKSHPHLKDRIAAVKSETKS